MAVAVAVGVAVAVAVAVAVSVAVAVAVAVAVGVLVLVMAGVVIEVVAVGVAVVLNGPTFKKYNATTGQMDDDYSELVRRPFDGPVYYETRAGLMMVAYPKYFGAEVDQGSETNRRMELAKSITKDDTNKLLAKAIVNRMWGHYFANGFTRRTSLAPMSRSTWS